MKVSTVIILSLFATSVTRSTFCPNITVTNSNFYNGEYWLDQNSQCYSRHSWVRKDGEYHLYYLFGSHDGWVISTNDCQSWGGFVALIKTPELLPWKVDGNWTEFQNDQASDTSNLSMKCQRTPTEDYTKSCLVKGCPAKKACMYESSEDEFQCVSETDTETDVVSDSSLNVALLLFFVLMTLTLILACIIMVKLFWSSRQSVSRFTPLDKTRPRTLTNPIRMSAPNIRKDNSYEKLMVT